VGCPFAGINPDWVVVRCIFGDVGSAPCGTDDPQNRILIAGPWFERTEASTGILPGDLFEKGSGGKATSGAGATNRNHERRGRWIFDPGGIAGGGTVEDVWFLEVLV
jgi:hypothetical protein